MSFTYDDVAWFSKTFGLLYLIAMSTIVVVYAYWPANKDEFERAAQAIIHDEDKPCP